MSYSFTVRAANKEQLKNEVAFQMDLVSLHQPAHVTDCQQVKIAANAYIDLLRDDPAQDVVASIYGNINGYWSGTRHVDIKGINISISVGMAVKQTQPILS